MDSTNFSHNLIQEYQKELYETYGFFVSEEEAQMQLKSLVRSLFPPTPLQRGGGNEVGASITPTSGQRDKGYD